MWRSQSGIDEAFLWWLMIVRSYCRVEERKIGHRERKTYDGWRVSERVRFFWVACPTKRPALVCACDV